MADLYIYDVIGADWGGMTANSFRKELEKTGPKEALTIHINSPGGSAADGLAIRTLLMGHRGSKTFQVDGLAASAASVIPMIAGDKVVMGDASMMMIHNAWTIVAGDADALEKDAADLRKWSQQLAEVYVKRSGQPVDAVKEWMNATTYFSAQESIDAGFADEIIEMPVLTCEIPPEFPAGNRNKWQFTATNGSGPPVIVETTQTVSHDDPEIRRKYVHRMRELALTRARSGID